jgi:hypothetical protein
MGCRLKVDNDVSAFCGHRVSLGCTVENSPCARLVTMKTPWRRIWCTSSHSIVAPSPPLFTAPPVTCLALLLFPLAFPFPASERTKCSTTPCCMIISLRCSWPMISFLSCFKAANCSRGDVTNRNVSRAAGGSVLAIFQAARESTRGFETSHIGACREAQKSESCCSPGSRIVRSRLVPRHSISLE